MSSRHQLRHEHVHALFRNPRFGALDMAEAEWIKLTRREPALADNIDPVLGGGHFLTRALGSNPSRDVSVCHFEGREQELRQLRDWIDGDQPKGSLRIVTGSPGMGKSALLGMLVCLMHPELRQFSRRFEDRLGGSLKPDRRELGQIAAVHARNRDESELVTSIGRQLAPDRPLSEVDHLIDQMKLLPRAPIIFLDALDEAADPAGVMSKLLFPLLKSKRINDSNLCRLIIGTREQPRFQPLFEAAKPANIIDLDDTDLEVLHSNVSAYVIDLLRETPEIPGAVARAFSSAVAETVSQSMHRQPEIVSM